MTGLKIGAFVALIFVGSLSGHYTVITYLKDKPLGLQTVLDTIHKDFFMFNALSISLHCISIAIVNLVGPMPPESGPAYLFAWGILYLMILSLSAGVAACLMRYFYVLKYNEIQDMDEWSLMLMVRASMTLPPTLISIHYYLRNIHPPIYHYITTHSRLEEHNPMLNLKGIIASIVVLAAMASGVITYFELKDTIRFQRQHKTQINLRPTSQSELNLPKSPENMDYMVALTNFLRKLKVIMILVILSTLIVMYADFPIGFDINSLAYLFGLAHQGIIVPLWFMSVYPQCLSFAVRSIQRSWPFACFMRLQRSQQSRA